MLRKSFFLMTVAALARLAGAVDLFYRKVYMGNDQTLIRDDNTAAHVMVSTSADVMQRVLVAFPALNSGSFIQLVPESGQPGVKVISQRNDVSTYADETGFNGIEVQLELTAPARINESIFGSIRIIRDFVEGGGIVHKGENDFKYKMYGPGDVRIQGGETNLSELTFVRTFFYEEDEVRFTLSSQDVAFDILEKNQDPEKQVDIGLWHVLLRPRSPGTGGVITVRTGINFPPPQPMSPVEIFWNADILNHELIDQLAFLSYDHGFLTGSWRFLTYFGRDTLFTTFLLFDDLSPFMIAHVLEAALGRISMSPDAMSEWPVDWDRDRDTTGFVCHEDEVGDFANWNGGNPITTHRLMKCDYKHADSDFLVLPLFARFVALYPGRAQTLLMKVCENELNQGRTYGEMLTANVGAVLRQVDKYSHERRFENLVPIRHEIVGNWRDSSEGLAFTKYPLDINGALVPAALNAIVGLAELNFIDQIWGTSAAKMEEAWKWAVYEFQVEIKDENSKIVENLGKYITEGSDCPECINMLDTDGDLMKKFLGVGIHANGTVAPVLNSDTGMILAFAPYVGSDILQQTAEAVRSQYPRGLHTDAGMLVTNSAYMWNYDGTDTFNFMASQLGRQGYHGAVIWGWQSMLMDYGLKRWSYGPHAPHVRLTDSALQKLWNGIDNSVRDQGAAEMWTFKFDADTNVTSTIDFESAGTEGNMVQLWSFGVMGKERPEPFEETPSSAVSNLAVTVGGILLTSVLFM